MKPGWILHTIVVVVMSACGSSEAPSNVPDTTGLQWGTAPGPADVPTTDDTPTPSEDPCETGQTKPCLCADGATGLELCDEEGTAPCNCEQCPEGTPITSSGFFTTSPGQYLFEHGHLTLTHRAGSVGGGGGCIVSATLTLAGGTPDAPGCAMTLTASGPLNPEGGLPITSLQFDADALCPGLPEADYGSYTTSELTQGTLLLTPPSVPGGADAECWSGELNARIEGLMTREDGKTIALSVSDISASGSGLSTGADVLCPGVEVPVDLNDCDKEVPLFADCNPYCQLGCDDGEQCVIDAAFFTCHPVGTLGFGATCSGPASCGPGMSCFPLPGSTVPVCQMPCIDDGDCPGPSQCAVTANLGGGSELSLCANTHQECDPLAQTGCATGQACYFDGGATLCWPPGTSGEGEICEGLAPNACGAGLHCLVSCRPLCSTGAESPSCDACPDGDHEISEALGLGFCLNGPGPSLCDLYTQSGCAIDEGCYPVPGGVACRPEGTIGPELPCTDGDSCVPGYACVSSACRRLCDLQADDAATTSCAARCINDFGAIEPVAWGMGVCINL